MPQKSMQNARATIPTKALRDVSFQDLTPLALKTLLYVVHRWNKRNRELAHIPPWERRVMDFQFKVSWHDLKAALTPQDAKVSDPYDYRQQRVVLEELTSFQVRRTWTTEKGGRGFRVINLVADAEYETDHHTLTYTLAWRFQYGLEMLMQEGFTAIPLQDALSLTDTRHIAFLMMVCEAANLSAPVSRQFEVEQIKLKLGLCAPSYEEWSAVWTKLKQYRAVVHARTSYRVQLRPVYTKEGGRRKVVAVQFDVTKRPP